MIFAILPVKAPHRAKQRLASLLSPQERAALARAMYEEVITALAKARGIDHLLVVTSDPFTADHASNLGAIILEESRQFSHSQSADAAARRAMALGATTALSLPIDIPLVTPGEIENLIASPLAGVRIVPDQAGTGTNALVRTPPNAIDSCFGPDSFEAHLRQARELHLPVQIVRPPGVVFDIDTPEDVAEYVTRAPQSRPAKILLAKCLSRL